MIISITGLAGIIVLLQQTQLNFYKSDEYAVQLLSAVPTQTPLPTPTPPPTYTPRPISIVIVTPIIEFTATNTIQIPPTISQLIPTIEPTFTLEPSPTATRDNRPDAPIVQIEQPIYDFDNGAKISAITMQQEQSLGAQDVVFDLSYLYQFIIALLSQLGVLGLLSANIQLIIIVGVAFLILALFIR